MTLPWCENETLSNPEPPVPSMPLHVSAISDQGGKNLKGQESRKEVQNSAFVKGQKNSTMIFKLYTISQVKLF